MKEKILIIQTAFLGDAVLTLPMIQKLKEKFPNSAVTVLCIPSTKELFTLSQSVDNLIVYDKKGEQKSLLDFIRLIFKIRREKFSFVYSPHRSLRSTLIMFFSGAGSTTGFDISSMSFVFKQKIKYVKEKHETARNLDMIRYDTSLDNWRVLPVVKIDEKAAERANSILNQITNRKLALVAPGSVWDTKIYPKDNLLEIIKYLIGKNYHVALIGGTDDQKICEEIESRFDGGIISFAGKLSLSESIALLRKGSLLITNDSAPTHLGMIADIKVLTIYCSTVPEFGFFPYNSKSRYVSLSGLECKPCGIHGHKRCPIKTFECGNNLLPEKVISVLEELLQD